MRKFILFILTFSFSGFLRAQDDSPFGLTFNHLFFYVKNLDRSVEFYTKVLKLKEISNPTKQAGMRWISLGGNLELHLVSMEKQNIMIDTASHFALATKHFDAVINLLNKKNIKYFDANNKPHAYSIRADGVKQIYFQDPDGYWVEVNNVGENSASIELIKNEVWQLEENYWKYVKNKDLKSYLTLWDDQFIGYPSTNKIGGKDHITDWITEMYKGRKSNFNYALTRQVENVFDDIVIVLYDATQIWTNDKNEVVEKETYKLTHTWKKTDKGWLIIGGMGAKK